jgi:hypothetical protein
MTCYVEDTWDKETRFFLKPLDRKTARKEKLSVDGKLELK